MSQTFDLLSTVKKRTLEGFRAGDQIPSDPEGYRGVKGLRIRVFPACEMSVLIVLR